MVFALRADEQMNLIPLGLEDAVNAAILEFILKLTRDKAEHEAVHRHGYPSWI